MWRGVVWCREVLRNVRDVNGTLAVVVVEEGGSEGSRVILTCSVVVLSAICLLTWRHSECIKNKCVMFSPPFWSASRKAGGIRRDRKARQG